MSTKILLDCKWFFDSIEAGNVFYFCQVHRTPGGTAHLKVFLTNPDTGLLTNASYVTSLLTGLKFDKERQAVLIRQDFGQSYKKSLAGAIGKALEGLFDSVSVPHHKAGHVTTIDVESGRAEYPKTFPTFRPSVAGGSHGGFILFNELD